MRVRVGWSGETATNIWQKADVELDEQDLQRMLIIDADIRDALTVPVPVAYRLLQNQAESLLLSKLITLGYPESTAGARRLTLGTQNAAILDALKSKLREA